MSEKTMTLREAVIELLRSDGPKHYQALTDEILAKGLASSSSKTPAASVNAMIAVDIKRNDTKSEFVRVRRPLGQWRRAAESDRGVGGRR